MMASLNNAGVLVLALAPLTNGIRCRPLQAARKQTRLILPECLTLNLNIEADAMSEMSAEIKASNAAKVAEIKLLPCPFCGGEPEILELGDDDSYYVHCTDCEVQQIANYRPHVAARRWNERK